MGALDRLPTLQEVQAERRSRPNWKPSVTRLDTKTASDTDDTKLLDVWAKAVRFRDRERCRVCGVKTVRTLGLDPKAGHAHHIVSRTCRAVRTDVRNGLWTCKSCHDRLHGRGRKLFVIGTAAMMFQAGRGISAKWYLDATCNLTFQETHP